MKFTMNKTLIASGVAMALGVPAVHAVPVANLGAPAQTTDSGNFTMLDNAAAWVGGTNDVLMGWDGNGFNNSSDYTGIGSTANITAASTTVFFNHEWTAHDIQLFVPGSYSFDTTVNGGNPESGILNVTVPAGQVGLHMLFDWNGNLNIDVFVVGALSTVFGSGTGRNTAGTAYGGNDCDTAVIQNCLHDGKGFGIDGKPAGNKVWMLGSVDGNGDSIMGIPMAPGGPFADFGASFSMQFAVSNFPPTAGSFSVSAVADQANTIDLLLPGRATDPDDGVDSTSIVIVSGPANGAIVVNNDGTVTYTPATGYTGADSFGYTVLDNAGAISAVGTASITVSSGPANVPPNANNTTFTINEDTASNIAVTAVADDGGDGPGPLTFNSFDALSAQGGTVTANGSNDVLTYTPLANFNGTDTFNFTVDDGIESSAPAIITMIVNAVNDAPVCTDVPLSMAPNTPLDINVATTLLSTCVDPDVGDTLTLDSTTQPTQGGTLTFDGANTLTYTPAAGFVGQDTFTYTVTDGTATDTRTVFVNVGVIFGNFTMLDGAGVTVGGTNDVAFTWDGTCYNSVADADAGSSNMVMASDSGKKFFGFRWFAKDIRVYCPGGPYVIDTCNDASIPADKCGPASMTVPAGHLGGHMLFDWNTTSDIDVLIVWNNSTGGTFDNSVPSGQIYQGPNGPTPALDTVYEWISTDADGDGIPGIQFVDGPFIDFRANFSFNAVGLTDGGSVTAPPTKASSPNLGGTGCSIAKAPVNPLSRLDWLLAGGFIAWLGSYVSRRRKRS